MSNDNLFTPTISMDRSTSTLAVLALSLLASKSFAAGLHHPRQSVPTVLPDTWVSKGCYSDISSARSLAGSSYVSSDAMTVESCIAFCINGGYPYAGVEFGQECYCDFAIQFPGTPTTLGQCRTTCSGSPLESCGFDNYMNVYHDAAVADPTIAETIASWVYQGCFSDDVSSRLLSHQIDVAGGLTPEKCTTACKANGFLYSGLEHSTECWCGNALAYSSEAPEHDCRMTCSGDRTKFCGSSDRITLYQDSDPNQPDSDPQTCQQTTVPSFNLKAVYKDTPSASISVKVIDVNTVPHVCCPSCNSAWSSNALQDGAFLPKSASNPNLRTASFSLVEGESPSFISTQFLPPPYSGYCLMGNSIEPSRPLVLAANSHSDSWSLCPNSTANGRVDIVYAAKPNHPHYIKANCREVYLEQV